MGFRNWGLGGEGWSFGVRGGAFIMGVSDDDNLPLAFLREMIMH